MTRDDIIRMAREAGLYSGSPRTPSTGRIIEKRLERFAALVAAAERERIIAQNAPEIEKINAHIKALEEAVAQRDALLEALKQVEPILARMYGQQAVDLPPMQIVRAAIKKAEENT
jgi:hypothetical protein